MSKVYRCTLNHYYQSPSSDGFTNLSARQGYYITAENPNEALRIMRDKYLEAVDGVTIEIGGRILIWELSPHPEKDKDYYQLWYHLVLCSGQKYLGGR